MLGYPVVTDVFGIGSSFWFRFLFCSVLFLVLFQPFVLGISARLCRCFFVWPPVSVRSFPRTLCVELKGMLLKMR